jgi:hypothetical protein
MDVSTKAKRKEKKPTITLDAHRDLAADLVKVVLNSGALLFVTTAAPPSMKAKVLLSSFAKACRRSDCATLAILDWSETGEAHVHAIVWTRSRTDSKHFVGPWNCTQNGAS